MRKKPKEDYNLGLSRVYPHFLSASLVDSHHVHCRYVIQEKYNPSPSSLYPVDRTKSTADLAHRGQEGTHPHCGVSTRNTTAMTKKQKRDRLLSDKLQFLSVHRINLPRSDGLCARSGRCERANCQRLSVSTNRRCPFISCVSSSEEKKRSVYLHLLSYFLKHQRLFKGGASVHSSNPLSSAPTYKIPSIHKTSIDSGAALPIITSISAISK